MSGVETSEGRSRDRRLRQGLMRHSGTPRLSSLPSVDLVLIRHALAMEEETQKEVWEEVLMVLQEEYVTKERDAYEKLG